MKHIYCYLVILISFASCSSIGNKILYRTADPIHLTKLAYVNSEYDTVTNGLYPPANAVFTSTVDSFIVNHSLASPQYIHTTIAFDNIDSLKMKNICQENDCDAILLTKLYFISKYFIYKKFLNIKPDNQQFLAFTESDVCVEMKLFDKNGKLLIFSSYNTAEGNGTVFSPKEGISKGIKGSLKEVFTSIYGKK